MTKASTKTTKSAEIEHIQQIIDVFLPVEDAALEDFKVGDIVRDRHTPFVGVIAVDIRWLNGTRRFQLAGFDKDGQPKGRVLDDVAVILIKPATVDRTPKTSGEFELGDKIRHSFIKKGPRGVITAVHLNENGCVQYEVCHPYKKSIAYILMHEHEMTLVEKHVAVAPQIKRTGAVDSAPREAAYTR